MAISSADCLARYDGPPLLPRNGIPRAWERKYFAEGGSSIQTG
jgi:hypothetical protein